MKYYAYFFILFFGFKDISAKVYLHCYVNSNTDNIDYTFSFYMDDQLFKTATQEMKKDNKTVFFNFNYVSNILSAEKDTHTNDRASLVFYFSGGSESQLVIKLKYYYEETKTYESLSRERQTTEKLILGGFATYESGQIKPDLLFSTYAPRSFNLIGLEDNTVECSNPFVEPNSTKTKTKSDGGYVPRI